MYGQVRHVLGQPLRPAVTRLTFCPSPAPIAAQTVQEDNISTRIIALPYKKNPEHDTSSKNRKIIGSYRMICLAFPDSHNINDTVITRFRCSRASELRDLRIRLGKKLASMIERLVRQGVPDLWVFGAMPRVIGSSQGLADQGRQRQQPGHHLRSYFHDALSNPGGCGKHGHRHGSDASRAAPCGAAGPLLYPRAGERS
jgi:hypothetical protein